MKTIEIFTSSSTTMIRIKIKTKITKIIITIITRIDSMVSKMKVTLTQNKTITYNKIGIKEITKNSMAKMIIPMKITCTLTNSIRIENRLCTTMKEMEKNQVIHLRLPRNLRYGKIIKIQTSINMIRILNNMTMEKISMITSTIMKMKLKTTHM